MQDFYGEVIDQLVRAGTLTARMHVLVLCGGKEDRTVLYRKGFRHVVISNVDPRPDGATFAPFTWCYQDAEHLTYEDETFDFCVVHNGLHHCHSPHRALLEMYRVSRTGLVLFEPYDNLLTRLGVRLNIGQEYEHASVVCNDLGYGGVANSAIPNYVYRWTERDVVKAINCYAPQTPSDVRFIHKMRVPWVQLRHRRNRLLYLVIRFAQPLLRLIEVAAPKQCNSFAAVVMKPDLPRALHPWLRQDGKALRLNEQWLAARFRRRPPTAAHRDARGQTHDVGRAALGWRRQHTDATPGR
ncbi:MAG TPA: methyltransferase domain-containing protein [Micromonosporaceae bacterium]|jgi:SAM-dependent methyltransferase|nr:methyltransferase domain-containing protein [Micromonosporaceae bacterium]